MSRRRRHDRPLRRRHSCWSLDQLVAAVVVDAALVVVAWRPAVDQHRHLRCTEAAVVEVADEVAEVVAFWPLHGGRELVQRPTVVVTTDWSVMAASAWHFVTAPFRETSFRESDFPGNICKPHSLCGWRGGVMQWASDLRSRGDGPPFRETSFWESGFPGNVRKSRVMHDLAAMRDLSFSRRVSSRWRTTRNHGQPRNGQELGSVTRQRYFHGQLRTTWRAPARRRHPVQRRTNSTWVRLSVADCVKWSPYPVYHRLYVCIYVCLFVCVSVTLACCCG